jgi:hypothetical protein
MFLISANSMPMSSKSLRQFEFMGAGSVTGNELDFHACRIKRINRCIPTRVKPHQNKMQV